MGWDGMLVSVWESIWVQRIETLIISAREMLIKRGISDTWNRTEQYLLLPKDGSQPDCCWSACYCHFPLIWFSVW